jgi:hypothetical protein
MNGRLRFLVLSAFLLPLAACATPAVAQRPTQRGAHSVRKDQPVPADGIDWKAVEAAMGRSGSLQGGGVFKFGMPRSDLSVTSRGVRIRPALSLGSWIAMKPRGENEVVAMGDLVLTEAEYNRVVERLQEGGVGQTAIHKHLLDEEPEIWWTHVHAHGDPVAIARTVRAALALTGTPAQTQGNSAPGEMGIDTAQIRRILGHAGKVNGGVYQVSVPRPETIRAMGIEVPPSMGTATALNFQPTGGGKAAINGDFVMRANEVDPVIRALKANGIDVVALHNHMLDEEPRLFFMHFWANDDATKLARGLRAGLDALSQR